MLQYRIHHTQPQEFHIVFTLMFNIVHISILYHHLQRCLNLLMYIKTIDIHLNSDISEDDVIKIETCKILNINVQRLA